MQKNEIAFECKYCRANTVHILLDETEWKGRKGFRCKCLICKYTSFIYKTKFGIEVNQTDIPDRLIILPHDHEYRLTRIEEEDEYEWNKEIDRWLLKPNWIGSTSKFRRKYVL